MFATNIIVTQLTAIACGKYYSLVRIVLDTNVLIDGMQDDFSAQAKLIDAAIDGKITALTTPQIEREYNKILRRLIDDPKYRDKINDFLAKTEQVSPQKVETEIDDPDDYKFLQAAAGGQADHLVTKDNHLLAAGEIGNARILTPQESWTAYQDDSDNNEGNDWQNFAKGIGLGIVLLSLIFSSSPLYAQLSQEDISAKKDEIAELEAKINELQSQRDNTAQEASLIDAQVKRLKTSLEKSELELSQTKASITETLETQEATTGSISDLRQKIGDAKRRLRSLLRELYQYEQESLVKSFFKNWSLSQVLSERAAYQELQDKTAQQINQLKSQEQELVSQQEELEQQVEDLDSLKQLQAAQAEEIIDQKSEQESFLSQKKAEQANYELKIADAKKAREEIEQQIFTLQSAGTEVKVNLNDAFEAAKYASELTGVRPSLILGVIKTESNLGKNVGTGKYPDSMYDTHHAAFLEITKKLGLDPYITPVSRGGGALGPGQFMPKTWLWMEPRVASLMEKPVANPFELGDAIVATAIYLADRGGTDPNREREAVGRYISPNWTKFTWYIDRVMAIAAEYEKAGI